MISYNRDKLDEKILRLLTKKGRMAYSEIGKKVGVSHTAVRNRVAAMEEAGVINGYKAIVDPVGASGVQSYVINLETELACFEQIKAELSESREMVFMSQTTGTNHLMGIYQCEDADQVAKYMKRLCEKYEDIIYIRAHAIIDVMKGLIIPD